LFDNAVHPYYPGPSRRRTGADPSVEAGRRFRPVKGEVPSPINPPSGCVFHPRCPIAVASCRRIRPDLREVSTGHWVACSEVY
jgi:oligopeptide transport system ATP-binding protein